MGKGAKLGMMAVLMGFIGLLFFAALSREGEAPIAYLSPSELEAACLAAPEPLKLNHGADYLRIQGEPAPYDAASNTYYIPCSSNEGGSIPDLSWSNGNQKASLGVELSSLDLSAAQREGTPFALLITQGERSTLCSLVLTGLPAVSVDIESDTETFGPYSKVLAKTLVFDPEGEDGYTVTACESKLSYRGASSRYFNKKSYNLKLYNPKDERGYSLLGLRQDNEWILKSMFTDPDRIREKLALDLWNDMAAENPNNTPCADFAYTEVFLDGAYLGLYGLMTPVDPVDYGFEEGKDVLFKAVSFDLLQGDPSHEERIDLGNNGIVFPTRWSENLWDGMLWYARHFYRGEAAEEGDLLAHLNRSNFVDYALFYSLISARDNNFSNTWYLTRFDETGDFAVEKIPWDLDMTFGNMWSGGWPDMTAFYPETIREVDLPHDTKVLLQAGGTETDEALRRRYWELRQDLFSEEYLIGLVEESVALLNGSGAISREQARWPEMTVYDDGADVRRHIAAHLAYLDERMAGEDPLYQN